MTCLQLIEYIKEVKPSAYSDAILLSWINDLEVEIQSKVWLLSSSSIKTHAANTEELLADVAHTQMYKAYLTAIIDLTNGEYNKYQNSVEVFNTLMGEYKCWYIRLYHPADGRAADSGYYISAYSLAVKYGYSGTEEQWVTATEAARTAAEAAQAAAETAAGIAGTKAGEAAASAQTAADKATAAETSATAAANAKAAAETAQQGAITAKTAAEVAQGAAETAKTEAVTAKTEAMSAKTGAETAKTEAEGAKTGAVGAKDAAVLAQAAAEKAQGLAEGANTAAQLAKTDAVTAKTAAEAAAGAANTKASEAATSAQNAAASASTASAKAQAAAASAQTAADKATAAGTSEANAANAKAAAETAQQAAVTAKTAAEAAQGLAESAKTAAEGAKTGAISAKDAAELAKTAAQQAQGLAETAQTAAQGAAGAAQAAQQAAEAAAATATQKATAAGTSALESEAWASGTINGVAVPSTHPAYQNNAKWYKDQAAAIVGGDYPTKSEAQGYATTAKTEAIAAAAADATAKANAAENAAKSYADQQIANIPPTDISGKLDKTGDGSNVTAAFAQATTRANIATGEKLSVALGKIAKWFLDFGSLAWKSIVAKTDLANDVQTSLGKADTALQAETDPTVPAWAKAASKPGYTKAEVGLGNVDNTSDANKPISAATQTALNGKANSSHKNSHKTGGADALTAGDIGAAVEYHGSATLAAASWAGAAAPYTYTLPVEGMLATDNGTAVIKQSGDAAADAVIRDAWTAAEVVRIYATAGNLNIVANGTKPTVNIPIDWWGCR